ncbi:MAG TPA: fructose-6-phosphate aldolase [Alphaproteobacteria bacterium]|nr:fructose-6-phosphate aldolase [Alphaproteobacteria bacterium]
MKFFVDTADVNEIKELKETGFLDGVTTNPSLIAKSGRDFKEVVKEICDMLPGLPVSAEVVATDYKGMVDEGKKLAKLASNVVIKLPLTLEGIKATKTFSNEGIKTNVTLCFSAAQAILVAKAGATYISPFVGRHDDIGFDGMELIADIRQIYDNYENFKTEILVASVRHPVHVIQAGKLGADVCTIPPSTIKQLVKHPLTDIGLQNFLKDWEKTGQKI